MTDHKQESKDLLQGAEHATFDVPSSHFTDAERAQILVSLSIAHALQALIELQGLPVFVQTDGAVPASKNVKGRKPATRKAADDGTA